MKPTTYAIVWTIELLNMSASRNWGSLNHCFAICSGIMWTSFNMCVGFLLNSIWLSTIWYQRSDPITWVLWLFKPPPNMKRVTSHSKKMLHWLIYSQSWRKKMAFDFSISFGIQIFGIHKRHSNQCNLWKYGYVIFVEIRVVKLSTDFDQCRVDKLQPGAQCFLPLPRWQVLFIRDIWQLCDSAGDEAVKN